MNARTAREAIAAEILGDIDTLLSRVEALPATVDDAARRIAATATTLDAAGDKYRMAVTAFTEETKVELTEFIQRKAAEVSARTVEEQRAAIQEAARQAMHSFIVPALPPTPIPAPPLWLHVAATTGWIAFAVMAATYWTK
jgi:hypothetical protein